MWFLIIGITILILGLVYINIVDDVNGPSYLLGVLATFFLMLSLVDHVEKSSYKQGQIDALNGKYKYEKSIQYELKDSTYTPVDTIYVEIE